MSKFNGKVAVITGGNSGIGLATAKELAANGAKVVITGREQETLDAAVQEIGHDVLAVRTDVSKLSEIENLFQRASDEFGQVDILFVNAGVSKYTSLEQSDEALFDEIVNINFKGSFFTVKYALPYLNDGASIIFTTGATAKKGIPGTSISSASKAALHALTKIFAAELVERGIRVNAVSPGPIDTPIYNRIGIPDAAKQEARAGMIAAVPMKRLGVPEEIAKAVAFLASNDSSFITGIEIDVDGGVSQL